MEISFEKLTFMLESFVLQAPGKSIQLYCDGMEDKLSWLADVRIDGYQIRNSEFSDTL
jgi:hypothetical protein